MKAFPLLLAALVMVPLVCHAATPQNLLTEETALKPSSQQVKHGPVPGSAPAQQISVQIAPGEEGYPGIALKSPAGAWDLKAYGHVSAKITNTGTENLAVSVRVDEAKGQGNQPWNTENLYLKAGESGTAKVIFGHSHGHKKSHPFPTRVVSQVLVFAAKSKNPQSFRIEALQADGPANEQPPVDPDTIRTKPENGKIYSKGQKLDPAKELKTGDGTAVEQTDAGLKVKLSPEAKEGLAVMLKPAVGRWVLRDFMEVHVQLKNTGKSPVTPLVSVEGNGITEPASKELAPGASARLVIPFAGSTIWDGKPNTGPRIASDVVSGVIIAAKTSAQERELLVESVTAFLPPPPEMPKWLGKLPPPEALDGKPENWVQTLDDNFDGTELNEKIWAWQGPNHWDKVSHWSKENVIVADGYARLRYARKTGRHNDDPKGKVSDYASGFLETYGKWVQRYGYFETRVKLPTAPGLWPAFWMLPDRGEGNGPAWEREATGNGGMEFDILEHLTRWGPNRYNIAYHWDGYQKDHKATGSDKVYAQPDKEGFITVGLLWLPGKAHMYHNGNKVAHWENERVSNVATRMMFTLVSGGWDNDPIDDAQLPADLVIDYVRVWQRKDLASDVDGFQPPAKSP